MKKRCIQNPLTGLLLIVITLAILFPLYIMIKTSISTPAELFQDMPPYGIIQPTLRHVQRVWRSGDILWQPLAKSLVTALGATLLSLLLAVPAAYAISRIQGRGRYLWVVILFAGRMIPEVSIVMPISVRFIAWGLFDSTAGLILAHCIRMLPVTCFILVGVFASLPRDLEAQAQIDGASRCQACWHVLLPLARPGLAVAAIFSFLLSWDEFIYASYLCLSRPTMPLKMYYYLSRGDIFTSATYALIITVPVVILTVILQRFVRPDSLAGALKG